MQALNQSLLSVERNYAKNEGHCTFLEPDFCLRNRSLPLHYRIAEICIVPQVNTTIAATFVQISYFSSHFGEYVKSKKHAIWKYLRADFFT